MRYSNEDIWEFVGEEFDEKLPRRTAILIKEEDFCLPFAYPSDFGSIGWLLDNRDETTYDESPIASIRFAEYSYPDLTGKRLAKNTFYFNSMRYYPSLARREIVFSNLGLEVSEQFAQIADGGGFVWMLDLSSRSHVPYLLEKRFYTTVSLRDPKARIEKMHHAKVMRIHIGKKNLFIASNHEAHGIYASVEECMDDLERGRLSNGEGRGRYLIFENKVSLSSRQKERIAFGLSFRSSKKAILGLKIGDPREGIKRKWNRWFADLPKMDFDSEEERKAYYKCWWTIRLNYYRHPRWGKTVIEALPVYRGYWQWALPAVEWHSVLNPEIGPAFVKTLLDLFLRYQRDDGYVTHAIYLNEKEPGMEWGKKNIIQTPHIPWVALRYYYATGDLRSLRKWYPRLVKYYRYLNESRDNGFLGLHLWAIIASFDTGLDTTSAFQKVTYGEDGERENFCYPAIFASERCRFEQSMANIASVLQNMDDGFWNQESEITRGAMNHYLWDEKKHWYGVLHENRSLDTRVGVDGLFPFAYALVDKERAMLAKTNFLKLIGDFGVFTVAPDEPAFEEETYWRGPAWSKSCSLAMATARNYYPKLLASIKDGLIRFLLEYPNVWECMSARTGKIARGDVGIMSTPVVSSNVGAGEAIGAFLIYHGINVFSISPETGVSGRKPMADAKSGGKSM